RLAAFPAEWATAGAPDAAVRPAPAGVRLGPDRPDRAPGILPGEARLGTEATGAAGSGGDPHGGFPAEDDRRAGDRRFGPALRATVPPGAGAAVPAAAGGPALLAVPAELPAPAGPL